MFSTLFDIATSPTSHALQRFQHLDAMTFRGDCTVCT